AASGMRDRVSHARRPAPTEDPSHGTRTARAEICIAQSAQIARSPTVCPRNNPGPPGLQARVTPPVVVSSPLLTDGRSAGPGTIAREGRLCYPQPRRMSHQASSGPGREPDRDLVEPIIEVADVHREYRMGGETVAALRGVSFRVM